VLDLFPGEGLDRRHRAQSLLHERHHVPLQVSPLAVAELHRLAEGPDGEHEEGDDAQGKNGQGGLEVPHDDEHGDEHDAGLDEREQGTVHHGLQPVGIDRHPGDDVPDGTATVEQEREPLEVEE